MKRISFERVPSGFSSSNTVADIVDYLNRLTEKLNELSREVYKNREEKNRADEC